MNSFQILLQHRQLTSFTPEDFLRLEERLKANQSYSLDDYLIQKKISSTEWTCSYQGLNSKTRTYHLVQVYRVGLLVEEQRAEEVARLRRLSRKIMRMNSDYVTKCCQCMQNEHFLIMVMELSTQQDTLSELLTKSPCLKQRSAVEWVKQVVCGLGQLYKQGIYLPEISTSRISVIDEKCKVNDFTHIEKKLTLTESDIVNRHVRQVGVMFYQMVSGKQVRCREKDVDNFSDTIRDSAYISELAKDFLLKASSSSPPLSWERLVQHKLFNDQTKRSSNLEFLKLAQIHPELPLKKSFTSTLTTTKQTQSQSLSHEQWDCQQYIQLQKTQLILSKITHDIAEDKVFDLNDRQVIEILYLMAVRSLNNLNHINSNKHNHQKSQFLQMFKAELESLQKQVSQTFYKYSSLLTQKQDQKLQVGKDWFNLAKSIIKLQFFESKRRNKFLTGIESTVQHQHDYTKDDQINFTQQTITNFLNQCKFHYSDKNHVYFFIKNYKQIMQVTPTDLEEMTFQQKVTQIILENSYESNP